MRKTVIAALISIAVAAAAVAGGAESDDRTRLKKLAQEIMDEIGTPKADRVEQCRSIGFGAKPCGGPWRYLVYSRRVSDSEKLQTLVAQYNALQRKINEEEGIASDCSAVGPPTIVLEGGECRAKGK